MSTNAPSNEDLMLQIILEDVENPNLRKLLERVIRMGDFQRACILKEMHMGSRAATTPAG
jgi:hypothetical protein